MKRNTHLSPDKYLSDAAFGLALARDVDNAARVICEDDGAKVQFFCEGGGTDEETYGYEVSSGGKHVQIDSGYELLTEAVAAFIDWSERMLGEDDDED